VPPELAWRVEALETVLRTEPRLKPPRRTQAGSVLMAKDFIRRCQRVFIFKYVTEWWV